MTDRLCDIWWTVVVTEISSTEDHHGSTHTFLISCEGFNFLWVHGPPTDQHCHCYHYVYWTVCLCASEKWSMHMHCILEDEAVVLLMKKGPKFQGVGQKDTHIHKLQEVLVCELVPRWAVGGWCDGEVFRLQGIL